MSAIASQPASVSARSIRPAKSRPRGLSALEEHRLRRALRRSVPSETWVDAQFVTITELTPRGGAIVYRQHDTQIFPPGGRRGTAMRWCRRCGRYTPPNCIHLIEHRRRRSGDCVSATLMCDDCRIAEDEERHHELWHTLPHLRPAGSMSFVRFRGSKITKNFS
jgi:hypothetical protein